jgi:hypothetical protein
MTFMALPEKSQPSASAEFSTSTAAGERYVRLVPREYIEHYNVHCPYRALR